MPPAKLLVLGATGNTGAQIVDLALERGHKVTAFVRSPERMGQRHDALTVVKGNVLQSEDLARALPGHDAVLSAIGPSAREAFRPSTLLVDCATSTAAAMNQIGMTRLGIVSAAMLFPKTRLSFRFFRFMLRQHVRDLLAMEAAVQATSLDFTIARPPRLVKSPETAYRAKSQAFPAGPLNMSFRAVAAFLLDSIEQHTFSHEIVGLAARLE